MTNIEISIQIDCFQLSKQDSFKIPYIGRQSVSNESQFIHLALVYQVLKAIGNGLCTLKNGQSNFQGSRLNGGPIQITKIDLNGKCSHYSNIPPPICRVASGVSNIINYNLVCSYYRPIIDFLLLYRPIIDKSSTNQLTQLTNT